MLDRNLRARLIFTAERLNRATRRPGAGGSLGLAALSIYRCLLFRWGENPRPSYRALRTATGHCVQTIAVAIKRLEAAGLLFVTRGTIRTRLGPRKCVNAYRFPAAPPPILIPREPRLQSNPVRGSRGELPPLESLSPGLRAALANLSHIFPL